MTSTPRSPGSRVVDHQPSLPRIIRSIQSDLQKLRTLTLPETLQYIPATPASWVACTSASMTNVLQTYVYRSGSKVFADVACGTGTGSVMRVQFSVPDLGITSATADSASGGTQQIVRIVLPLPDTWASGDKHLVYIQAMRVSGTDSTTVQVLRSWQR